VRRLAEGRRRWLVLGGLAAVIGFAGTTVVPVRVALGITDHAYAAVTAVIAGQLQPGDDVVTTALTARTNAPGAQGFRR
jgi:hypothetical protein